MKGRTMITDNRKTKNGYFNLEGYLEYLEINWKTDNYFLMLNCERNVGKSVSTWNFIMKFLEHHNYKKKFLYLRCTAQQVKRARQDFNERYKPNFWMSGDGMIYKNIWEKKETGINEIIDRFEVGSSISLSTGVNLKSGGLENYGLIFFDEYNDNVIVPNQFMDFVQIAKTAKRFTDNFGILFIGNKDNANNEFMVTMGAERAENPDYDHISRAEEDPNFIFIDVGFKTFEGLKQGDDMINRIARYNETSNRYLNEAGYISDYFDDVVNFKKRILPKIGKPITILGIGLQYFIIGKWDDNTKIYIKQITTNELNQLKDNIRVINPTANESINSIKKTGITESYITADLMEMLYIANQKGTLYFCSFDIRHDINRYIGNYISRINNKN